MSEELREVQLNTGATFEPVAEVKVPVSFGNDAEAIAAARQGVALADLSHWGLLKVSDEDRLSFLHNQSTNDFQRLQPGQGCDTVFVTSTARTIDLATAYVTEDAVLLLVSPNRRQTLLEWLDRYLFPMDRVELTDVSSEFTTFSLMGSESDALLTKLGIQMPIDEVYGSHQQLKLEDIEVRVAVGSGLVLPGYTLIAAASDAAKLWQTLTAAGAIPMGDRIWEQLRIEQGRPVPDRELTEDYNPLEAGLWQTISFNKGCYIGQETIARLNTYKGVKQQLWGVRLQAPAEPGTIITAEGEKVGKLTSLTETDRGLFGLAYIRTKAGGLGLKVQIGDVEGEIVDVPFLTHEYNQS
ncbi:MULTISPECIES: YgfZ/GcvT domain-containing protein [unclassified Coleofasciculus]|uniref:CAF17-like 4Fe-4S cluster assembly/insertion protein YgfZ n=1 Tax=unclassified Coleofasciculus TaxID=2692782 RepID=UPI001880BC8D|nr:MULTISPECIES: folate-binding protein YgfZ [unclassified Coleofasciculus]MBE9125145.1 folate-binding protein YgfZ [Coleofasciculus sp. LEGE 07081]MBE9148362.1 folate-binding protein YgfZ [Coleofasciculus sp. LEGE 07092]